MFQVLRCKIKAMANSNFICEFLFPFDCNWAVHVVD